MAPWFALFMILLRQYVVAEPQVTPGPIPPSPANLLRQRMILEQEQRLHERAAATSSVSEIDNLAYCYGSDSICTQANGLFDACQQFMNLNGPATKWWQCLCGNGYVATNLA
jgi:hypothetical protein